MVEFEMAGFAIALARDEALTVGGAMTVLGVLVLFGEPIRSALGL